jgi:hypothetical protein
MVKKSAVFLFFSNAVLSAIIVASKEKAEFYTDPIYADFKTIIFFF